MSFNDVSHLDHSVHGIDMPSRAELVAHRRTMENVAEPIGADLAQLGILGLICICSGRVLDAWNDVSIR